MPVLPSEMDGVTVFCFVMTAEGLENSFWTNPQGRCGKDSRLIFLLETPAFIGFIGGSVQCGPHEVIVTATLLPIWQMAMSFGRFGKV